MMSRSIGENLKKVILFFLRTWHEVPAFKTKVGSKARRAEIDQKLKKYIPKNERR